MGREPYMEFLWFSNRNALSSVASLMYRDVNLDICGQQRRSQNRKFSSLGWKKPIRVVLIFVIKSPRRLAYNGHLNKKCSSFSALPGQNGHIRSTGRVMFWCRPFSIIRLWFESRSLVRAILSGMFCTIERYCSGWMLFFSDVYVLIFDICFISAREDCWNMSFSLKNTRVFGAIPGLGDVFRKRCMRPILER